MTTPRVSLRQLEERDGKRSAWTGLESETLVPHHRANRGMGGSKALNRPSNLLLLESHINGLLESDPWWAAEARARGIKISRYDDPATTPVLHAIHGLCLLSDDNHVTPTENQ